VIAGKVGKTKTNFASNHGNLSSGLMVDNLGWNWVPVAMVVLAGFIDQFNRSDPVDWHLFQSWDNHSLSNLGIYHPCFFLVLNYSVKQENDGVTLED
jgi:hypothetical protein